MVSHKVRKYLITTSILQYKYMLNEPDAVLIKKWTKIRSIFIVGYYEIKYRIHKLTESTL